MTRTCTVRKVACICVLMLGCTQEWVDPTVIRFAVYSDTELARIQATVLDSHGRPSQESRTYELARASSVQTSFRFRFFVKRTGASLEKDVATVRFSGYREASPDAQEVLRRTVRVRFVEQHTRLARIWLARTCETESARAGDSAVCAQDGLSCAYATGRCQTDTVPLATEEFAAGVDDQVAWQPDDYPVCGNDADGRCPARFCDTAADYDCGLSAGMDCNGDDVCQSGFCAKACVGSECGAVCCESRCDDGCAFCDRNGRCQHLDYSSDRANCGACGAACDAAHAETSCRASVCIIDSCADGFRDCAGGAKDGCETEILTNPQHCGRCEGGDAVCHYGRCGNGACLGKQIPQTAYKGLFPTGGGELIVRLVQASEVQQVSGVGLHVQNAMGRNVRLLLVQDDFGDPGTILASEEIPMVESIRDARGEYGSELMLPQEVPVNGLFWIGFVLLSETAVKWAASTEADDVRHVSTAALSSLQAGATLPMMERFTDRPRVDVLGENTITAPWVYAVHF